MSLLDRLTDPRMVGATEYAAIYDALSDAVENAEEDGSDPRELLLAMCDEFIAHATEMRAQLVAATQAAHEAEDPHCTCNDCIEAHARRLEDK